MYQQDVPQHPGRQGLGQPMQQQPQQGGGNPYYKANPAMDAIRANGGAVGGIQPNAGAIQPQEAQIAQANAMADQERAKAAMMAQYSQPQQEEGLGQPDVLPQEVEAQQIAEQLLTDQVTPEQLQQAVEQGQIDPNVAQNAYMLFQEQIQKDEQTQLPQIDPRMAEGLGGTYY
jgi:hypothetical protein